MTRLGTFFNGIRSTEVISLTLGVTHPLNDLGVPADPVVIYHDMLGQILILIEAPAPLFISEDYFGHRKVNCYDVGEAGVVPAHYYSRSYDERGWIRAS